MTNSIKLRARGFTLVELLVVIAIIGILTGLTLPGVQQIRESARRSHCQNNLKNLCLGLLSYESARRTFPLGSTYQKQHSWGTQILPFVEQGAVSNKIDFDADWNNPVTNLAIAKTNLPVFQCPSSLKDYTGRTDYSGISGSWRSVASGRNGILLPATTRLEKGIHISSVTDGTDYTICLAEGAEMKIINGGFWSCGKNCFTHEEGGVANPDRPEAEILSDHPSGANVAFCSGAVRFITEGASAATVAALCTRNNGEIAIVF